MQVFDFTDYRDYLFHSLGGDKRTGKRQKLAKFLDCQPAHLSQVLKFKNNLSLEFAHKANAFLGHSSLESEYFLNLVLIGNAGTLELKNYYQIKNSEIKIKALELGKNIKSERTVLNSEEQALYYSNEIYALIHVAVSLPTMNTIEDLVTHLKYDFEEVHKALDFLRKVKIVRLNDQDQLTTGVGHTFLDKNSPFLKSHHFNLRRTSEKRISQGIDANSLHYATYFTLSQEDYKKIHRAFMDIIDANLKTIAPSKEEVLCCNVIDFFKIDT
jgi:uncharacterized protein (TIGR02147 family)